MNKPSEKSQQTVNRLVEKFTKKSGTFTHPNKEITNVVKMGLAKNIDELKRPLCPCRFYPDKQEEIKYRTWLCPCDDMQIYKYCHCLLFVTEEGDPITEYLPEDHEGKEIYGVTKDPTPDLGRAMKKKAPQREIERKERAS